MNVLKVVLTRAREWSGVDRNCAEYSWNADRFYPKAERVALSCSTFVHCSHHSKIQQHAVNFWSRIKFDMIGEQSELVCLRMAERQGWTPSWAGSGNSQRPAPLARSLSHCIICALGLPCALCVTEKKSAQSHIRCTVSSWINTLFINFLFSLFLP